MQRARAGPLHERIGLAVRARAIEVHRLRAQRLERTDIVGDDERMRPAVVGLFDITEQPFRFHQPVTEIPVAFVLHAERALRERLAQCKAECSLRLRMGIEYIGENRIGGFILPDAGIRSEAQKMQP